MHIVRRIPVLILLLGALGLGAQVPGKAPKFTISGYIEDGATGEKLIAANVFDSRTGLGTVSNTYGFYSLTLPAADTVLLSFSYIGYETQSYALKLDKDLNINVQLGGETTLSEVEVVAERIERNVDRTQMSSVDVPVSQIKKIPALLGETDVLKALQLLPGIQSGNEGSSGLYVRGGSPDQNLILLDGVPVYNVSHLFGFFSVFNADAIKNVTLTKGGFPARYGGRLSSVLEINMKEGNMQEFHGEGSLGIVASRLTLEGPLDKDKTAFVISARRTYIDILARPFITSSLRQEGVDGVTGYYFYDLNGKINHKFNDAHRLYLSVYTGRDDFYARFRENEDNGDFFETDAGLNWGNVTSALRWNYLINNKLFSNVTLTYSNYAFDITNQQNSRFDGEDQSFGAIYLSGIEDYGAKVDFDYIPDPNHYVRFGFSATHHTFKPGALNLKAEIEDFDVDTIVGTSNTRAMEYALYVEDDLRIGERFSANVGLHASAFAVGQKTYPSLQPRLGMRYLLPKDWALKGSFATMTQFIHLLTNEGIGLPTDLWVPSTERVVPEEAWQAALGVAKNFGKDYEFSAEVYYKDMRNLVSYKEGASFLELEGTWEDRVEQGRGRAYGLELFVQKKRGRTTGWVGYTLAWTDRTFENINGGQTYPFRYDRRHDLSIVVSHDFSDKLSISGTWVYGTGNAVTLPIMRYDVLGDGGWDAPPTGGAPISEIERPENKNAFRMASYHRLDLNLSYTKPLRYWTGTFNVGAYNAYSRNNPFYIYATTENNERVFKQVSLFPIIPYVSYNFKF